MDKSTAGAGFPVWATVLLIGLFCIPIGMQLLGFGTVVANVDASTLNPPGVLAVERSLPPAPDSAPPVIPPIDGSAELVAQQWMAWAGFWTTLLTATGIILIWRTLLATRQTLREAERATAAALATVAVTREIGEAQTSPFLMVKSGGKIRAVTTRDEVHLYTRFSIKNAGHTATRSARMTVQVFATQRDGLKLFSQEGRIAFYGVANLGPMEPSGEYEFDERFVLKTSEIERSVRVANPEAGKIADSAFVVWVTLSWVDFAGKLSAQQHISIETKRELALWSGGQADLEFDFPRVRDQL